MPALVLLAALLGWSPEPSGPSVPGRAPGAAVAHRGDAERFETWRADFRAYLDKKAPKTKREFQRDRAGLVSVTLRALGALVSLLGLAWLLSTDRRRIRWKPVVYGLGLQAAVALLVLNPVVGKAAFQAINAGVGRLLSFAEAGIGFALQAVQPHTATYQAGPGHWVVADVVAGGGVSPAIKTLAFWVLPTIIFFSSLLALLYHFGIMQWIVSAVARLMQHFMGTSGAETLSCAANVFVGQTEAPLLVRPFVPDMTRSELMAVMTGGFATVAGGVLAVYVSMLRDIPGIAAHLVTASLMAAPGALAVAKIVVPETGTPKTAGISRVEVDRPDANGIEAVARGATDGMTLVLNVVAMLIAFVAMVALADWALGALGRLIGTQLSLDRLLGWLLSPLAWLMGASWKEASLVGHLLGKKLVLTELLAYVDLSHMQWQLTERAAVMASYALCGFANVASIGIQIGGIGAMAPSRRGDLARLGFRAMAAGAIVSCISGTWAQLLFKLNHL